MTVVAKNRRYDDIAQAAPDPPRRRKPAAETDYPSRTIKGSSLNEARSNQLVNRAVNRFTSIEAVGY